jgi:hypothetical protein
MTASNESESAASEPLERLLTEREYCGVTGESLGTARRNRQLGQGCPYVKLNFLVRYRPSDVLAYIEENLRTTTSMRRNPKRRTASSKKGSRLRRRQQQIETSPNLIGENQ